MKINEMNLGTKEVTKRALKENFEVSMNFEKLDAKTTKTMLQRVRGIISESRTGKQAHNRHQNPAYMKAVMMEQALATHYQDLRVQHQIMLENEEVQKSQVILAAQDMIDSVQKMVEQISKMKVEELPAVVTGVNNEIGTSEGEQFNSSVSQALTTLEESLNSAKTALTQSLGAITGDGGELAPAGDMGGEEMSFGGEEELPGGGEAEFDGEMEMGDMPEMPEEEPEEIGNAGRKMR